MQGHKWVVNAQKSSSVTESKQFTQKKIIALCKTDPKLQEAFGSSYYYVKQLLFHIVDLCQSVITLKQAAKYCVGPSYAAKKSSALLRHEQQKLSEGYGFFWLA